MSITQEEYLQRAHTVHGDKYDYSKTEYVNMQTKIIITCPTHGDFEKRPDAHCHLGPGDWWQQGCPVCSKLEQAAKRTKSQKEVIANFKKIHGDKYDYSKVKYIKARAKVCIVCPTHGDFWQRVDNHLRGNGCPGCAGRGHKDPLSK